jgi:hypothetical protein
MHFCPDLGVLPLKCGVSTSIAWISEVTTGRGRRCHAARLIQGLLTPLT